MSRLVHVNFREAAYRQKLSSVLALLTRFSTHATCTRGACLFIIVQC